MDKQNKIILLSKFFAKERIQGDLLLDRLFELDDMWSKVYRACRKTNSSLFSVDWM